jgi:hypothetical protein
MPSNHHGLLNEDRSTPTQSSPQFQQPSQSPLQYQTSFHIWPPRLLSSVLPPAWSLILKIPSVPEALLPFWEPFRTLPPTTNQVNNPQLPKWISPALSLSSRHSADSKTSQGLRWLLVVLEQQRTTSWDMAMSSRLWGPTWVCWRHQGGSYCR